jgi:hypothetical protein
MRFSNEILQAYLNCKTKSRLKLAGESGSLSDHESMTTAVRESLREQSVANLVIRFPDASRGVSVTAVTLKE